MKVHIRKYAVLAMLILTQVNIYPASLGKAVFSGDVQELKRFINSMPEEVNKQDILGEVYAFILTAPTVRPELVEYLLTLKPNINQARGLSGHSYLTVAIAYYYLYANADKIKVDEIRMSDKGNAQKVLAIIDLLLQQPEAKIDQAKASIENPFAMITGQERIGMTRAELEALITPQQKDALRAVINKYEKR